MSPPKTIEDMSKETKPWERQRDCNGDLEPNLWYDRFTHFRLMSSTRSLLGCYKEERARQGKTGKPRTPPKSWLNACEQWNWRERAEAWDEAERERIEAEYEAERLEWRKKRRQLLQGFFGQLAKALAKYDPSDASLGQLTQALRVAVQELRAEYDDLPTSRQEITGAEGGPIKHEDVGLTDPQRVARLAAIFDAARTRRSGPTDE